MNLDLLSSLFSLGLILYIHGSTMVVVWLWDPDDQQTWFVVLLNLPLILVYWNYYLCWVTDPGHVPGDWVPFFKAEYRYCGSCRLYKPLRTHHCSTCRRCVLKMDHHCPFVSNCIGFYNLVYFIRLLLWIVVSCMIYEAIFIHIYVNENSTENILWIASYYPQNTWMTYLCVINFVIVLLVFLAIGFLLGRHVLLVLKNMTLIEAMELETVKRRIRYLKKQGHPGVFDLMAKGIFPYDLGIYDNIKTVVGTNWLFWICFVPVGDGISYDLLVDEDTFEGWPPHTGQENSHVVIRLDSEGYLVGESKESN